MLNAMVWTTLCNQGEAKTTHEIKARGTITTWLLPEGVSEGGCWTHHRQLSCTAE
jgi:hypothetical protein